MNEVLEKSVTKRDRIHSDGADPSTVWRFVMPFSTAWSILKKLPLDPPPYWSRQRDQLLRSTTLHESLWGSAIYKAATKIASLPWAVDDVGKSERKTKRAHELCHTANAGQGWVPFILQAVKAFTCTDSGVILEIVRSSPAVGSRVMGIVVLDTLRCMRTGDNEFPIVYTDTFGHDHVMKSHQVAMFSDMPSSDPVLNGVGECAASRAYPTIVKAAVVERYKLEKISGARPQALYFVNGVSPEQVQTAIENGEADMISEGAIAYMGAIIAPSARNIQAQVSSIELASLPDGWDSKEEREDVILKYANSIGIFVGDLAPIREGSLGNGVQAALLDESAEGMGLSSFRKHLEHVLSWEILAETTQFTFTRHGDPRTQKAEADASKTRADTRKVMKDNGEITDQEARQMAGDAGDIPAALLVEDQTPEDSLLEDEKPAPDEEDVDVDLLSSVDNALELVELELKGFSPVMKSLGVENIDQFLLRAVPQGRKLYRKVLSRLNRAST